MPPPSASGTLKILGDANAGKNADVDFLLIPGVSTPATSTWTFSSRSWLSAVLPHTLRAPRILSFDYTVPLADGEVSIDSFIILGETLLRAVTELRSGADLGPLFVVCHSVGGLILKQALSFANEQPYKYGNPIPSVAGIVFAGTPHKATSELATLSQLLMILTSTTQARKPTTVKDHRVAHERSSLWQLACRFESVNLRVPVCTILETEKTKIRDGLLKRKTLLADKAFCKVDSDRETFLSLPLDHIYLCHVEKSGPELEALLQAFVSATLREAVDMMSARQQACEQAESLAEIKYIYRTLMLETLVEFKYATTSSYSPTASDYQFDLDLSSDMTPESSLRPVAGVGTSAFESLASARSQPKRPPKANLPCIMLDAEDPTRVFFGREDIMDVISQELLSTNAPRPENDLRQFALCGLGGVGKTHIAWEFARRHKDEFDAIFWVQADEPAKLDECFQRISVRLGLETSEEARNQVVSRNLVKGWLSNPIKVDLSENDRATTPTGSKEASWLLIFDNADDPRILADFWPDGSGSVLITSRDPLAKRIFSTRSSGLDLESMDDDEGGALLLKLTETDQIEEPDAEATARRISELLAGLPLAISQMAGIIRRQELSLSEFLVIFEDTQEHATLFGMKFNASARTYQHSIATVWAFEKVSTMAQTLLQLITFMDPDTIQEDVLFDAADAINQPISLSRLGFSNARTELSQSSLIKRDKTASGALSDYHISAHRLVQSAVLATMKNAEMEKVFETLVRILWGRWPAAMLPPSKHSDILEHGITGLRYQVARYPLCAALYPHVIRLKQLWPTVSAGLAIRPKMQFAALLTEAAWYQHERARTHDFEGFWALAETICKDHPCDESNAVLVDIHFCVGVDTMISHKWAETRRRKEAFLALQKSICAGIGEDYVDERLALAYTEMAAMLVQEQRYADAIQQATVEREIRRRIGFKPRPLTRDITLAIAYMQTGHLSQAETLLQGHLETAEATGTAHVDYKTGTALYWLASLRSLQDRQNESYQLYLEALQSFTKVMSDREAAVTRHKIAEHLARMGRNAEAIATTNSALQYWSHDTETYRPELARTTLLKARLLEKTGRDDKAKVAYKVASRLWQQLTRGDKRNVQDLQAADFDPYLMFYHR